MSADASERWLELAAQFPVTPKRSVAALRSSHSDEQVSEGQLRRAYWGDRTAIVLVVAVDDTDATADVWPATLEPGVENEAAIVVEESASPLHAGVSLWPTKPATIPFAALDQTVAVFPKTVFRAISSGVRTRDIEGIRLGESEPEFGSGVEAAIDELFDTMDVLEAVPQYRPSPATGTAQKLPVALSDLIVWLDIPQAHGMSILLGKQPLSAEQAQTIARRATLSVDEVWGSVSPLPSDLDRELQEPRWRRAIRNRAVGGDEVAARSQLGYDAFQLAARQGAGDGREKWRQRIEAALTVKGS
ncbi:hypothetical protein [Luethyella okanaganae]|uniref:Uncharacterized protein n=1 Tax=Luethyella okanaganae TaxID=69372 RepID=A0ABW1VEK0_9MICO